MSFVGVSMREKIQRFGGKAIQSAAQNASSDATTLMGSTCSTSYISANEE